MEKLGKWILSGLLYVKMKKKKKKVKISELSLSVLGCWKQPSVCARHSGAGRQGAGCLPLAKLLIWDLKFYL